MIGQSAFLAGIPDVVDQANLSYHMCTVQPPTKACSSALLSCTNGGTGYAFESRAHSLHTRSHRLHKEINKSQLVQYLHLLKINIAYTYERHFYDGSTRVARETNAENVWFMVHIHCVSFEFVCQGSIKLLLLGTVPNTSTLYLHQHRSTDSAFPSNIGRFYVIVDGKYSRPILENVLIVAVVLV